EATGPHARVVAAGRAARARGVQPGRHTVAQARALAADLVVRARDAAAERSAARALAEVAASLASRVETAADGAVYLDVDGATHLVASERALATALVARATRVGLESRVGVAAGMTVARLAAEHGDGTEVVPAGVEQGFLAPLPLACLGPPPEIASTLQRWGVHRLGGLARSHPVARRADARREGDPRLLPDRPRGAPAVRRRRARRAHCGPRRRPRGAARSLRAARTRPRAAGDDARAARGAVRARARRGTCRRRFAPARRRVHRPVHALAGGVAGAAAGGRRLPARRPRAPLAASRGGVA